MSNKFLKTYPQLWIPSIGDRIILIHVPIMALHVPYLKIGLTGTIKDIHPRYTAKFDLDLSKTNYSGICSIGDPHVHFTLYENS